MYDAKRHLAGVAHYSSDRDPYSARRLSLISDLSRALDERTLEVHYQPQAEPDTGRVTGVERYPDTQLKLQLGKPGYPVVSTIVAANGEFAFDSVPAGSSDAWITEAGSNKDLVYRSVEVQAG